MQSDNEQSAYKLQQSVNDENELNTLLAYYRERINEFENERVEWLQTLEQMRFKYEEKHKNEWEVIKVREEIAELQKNLSETKLSLFDERKQFLNKGREIDQLRLIQIEDRKRISEFLQITDSKDANNILCKDLRPEIVSKYPNTSLNIHNNQKLHDQKLQKYGAQTTNRSTQGCGPNTGKNLVKTIYMPNEQLNTLAVENDQLKTQFNQMNDAYQQEINCLQEELKLRNEEAQMKINLDNKTIEELQQSSEKSEKKLFDMNKEYFHHKVKYNEYERQLKEEKELLQFRNQQLSEKLHKVQTVNQTDNKVGKELADKRAQEYTNKFRAQVKQKDLNIAVMKEQYSKVQNIYIEKMQTLESNLQSLSEKYQSLEKKRLVDLDSYTDQINRLNQILKNHDAQQLQSHQEQIPEKQKKQKTLKESNKFVKSNKNTVKLNKNQIDQKNTVKQYDDQKVQYQQESMNQTYNTATDNESVNLSELEDIKKQLLDLENKLDLTKSGVY